MTGLTLKNMILNEIDNAPRGYSEELAKIALYSNGSNLKKVLKDEKKEFENFNSLLKLVRYIWGNDYVEMIVKYSNEIDPKKKTARNMLEFLATNKEYIAFHILLDKMDACSNVESREWSKIYRFIYKYDTASKQSDFDILLKEISETLVTSIELQVYKNLLLNYCFEQKHDYNMTMVIMASIENSIDAIENEYIKSRYKIRLNEIMSYNQLRVNNNPKMARKYADETLLMTEEVHFHAYAYYIKGVSYMFTSLEKAITFLNKSIELYREMGNINDVKDIEKEIEFMQIYWGEFESKETLCLKNQYLLNIKNGVEFKFDEKFDPEIDYYLSGLKEKDNKKLLMSFIKFIKSNDNFMANLPKLELIRNGYDEDIIFELASMRCA